MNIGSVLSSGEGSGFPGRGKSSGDDLRTIEEFPGILTDDGQLSHDSLEFAGHCLLVVDEGLPGASGAGIAGEAIVGLKTHFADVFAGGGGERGKGFAEVTGGAGNAGTFEEDLKEDLSVELRKIVRLKGVSVWEDELTTKGVLSKGTAMIVGSVEDVSEIYSGPISFSLHTDVIRTSDGVGGKKSNHFFGAEASAIFHTGENGSNVVLGLRNKTDDGRGDRRRTTSQELEAGSTRAVGDTDGGSELDEIAGAHVVDRKERSEEVDGVGNTEIGWEVGLHIGERDGRTIGTTSAINESVSILQSTVSISVTLTQRDQ